MIPAPPSPSGPDPLTGTATGAGFGPDARGGRASLRSAPATRYDIEEFLHAANPHTARLRAETVDQQRGAFGLPARSGRRAERRRAGRRVTGRRPRPDPAGR